MRDDAGAVRRLLRILRTVRGLSGAQVRRRLWFLRRRRSYERRPSRPVEAAVRRAAGAVPVAPLPRPPDLLIFPAGMQETRRRGQDLAAGRYEFLNRAHVYADGVPWRSIDDSPLWVYQLQYLGGVAELVASGRPHEARALFTSWSREFGEAWDRVAWHPYPVSLRIVNLCLAAGVVGSFERLGDEAADVVARQAAFLGEHLETDVRGNHLLENGVALVVAGKCFEGRAAEGWLRSGLDLLRREVPEQVHDDGGHFELSPMYHCIVMHRLLLVRWFLGEDHPFTRDTLSPTLESMATWLARVLCPDGDIPLLGDSVRGFAPTPAVLFDLTGHDPPSSEDPLSPEVGVTHLPDTGLCVLRSSRVWAILDGGPVCPDYLPAHGQADSLTFEAWTDGACVVGDPGVYDYAGPQRAWGRASVAHSTVTLCDRDNSEVYGSFRVGARARVRVDEVGESAVTASMVPAGRRERIVRRTSLVCDRLEIFDRCTGDAEPPNGAVARFHLAPGVTVIDRPSATQRTLRTRNGQVRVRAESAFRETAGFASRRFGVKEPTVILAVDLVPSGDGSVVESRVTFEPLDED